MDKGVRGGGRGHSEEIEGVRIYMLYEDVSRVARSPFV